MANSNLEKKLRECEGKNMVVLQEGFIQSKNEINRMKYKIANEILSIIGEKTYIKINLNQIYNIVQNEDKIELFLDNDTMIILI